MKTLKRIKIIILSLAMIIGIFTGCGSNEPTHSPYRTAEPTPVNPYVDEESELKGRIDNLPLPEDIDVLYIAASTGDGANCRFYALEKDGDNWDFVINTSGILGKNNTTPTGFFKLGEAFGTGKGPDTMKVPYKTIMEAECPAGEKDNYQYCVRITEDILLYCKAGSDSTDGSIAIPKGQMIRVMKQLTENSYIIIVEKLDDLESVSY